MQSAPQDLLKEYVYFPTLGGVLSLFTRNTVFFHFYTFTRKSF